MAGLSFNPAFHSAILNTLREGVIHLALPQPAVARQSDFPPRALNELMFIRPNDPLHTRFAAASDLIRFATRDLPEADRPQFLAPLWGSEPWKPETSFMAGILLYLEGVTGEACYVVGENVFQITRRVWENPSNLSHWEVLMDVLEAKGVPFINERRMHLRLMAQISGEANEGKRETLIREKRVLETTTLEDTLSRNFSEGSISVPRQGWKMGFPTIIRVKKDHEKVVKRFPLVPEARFIKQLDSWNFSKPGALALAKALPASQISSLNLRNDRFGDPVAQTLAGALPASRVTSLTLHGSRIGDAGALALAEALPASQITSLNVCNNQISDAGALALAGALPASRVTSLNLSNIQIGDATRQALKELAQRTGININL